ncbi:hypothetical protein [Paractinoplanes deccanensis]|uniref:hypothetical protein n=1 Tax=Paractinoplanes deccanensis TaxID=113561 RepID=UPI001942CE7A|nr:hypothetical protein [Actinoplanes deccanensis]
MREQERILAGELAGGWSFAVILAAFVVAARRRFDRHVDRRMVTRFAWRFVLKAPGGDRFQVRDVDATLRVFMGDEYLSDALTDVFGEITYAVLFALADDLELTDQQVVQLVAEAEAEIVGTMADGRETDRSILGDGRYRRIHRPYLAEKHWLPARPDDRRPPRTPKPPAGRRAPTSLAGRYVLSLLLHRGAVQGVSSDDVPNGDLLRVMRTSFAVAAPLYLHPDPDVREIDALVATTRKTLLLSLDPMKAAYLVRLAVGERVPLDGITSEDVYLACSLMWSVIAERWDRDEAVISDIIAEAEAGIEANGYRLTPGA